MTQLLARLRHFEILNKSDLEWLSANVQTKTYQVGDRLIEEGRGIDAVYLALTGKLAILEFLQGQTSPMLLLEPSEFVGEAALISQNPSSITIEAVEASEVLALPRQKLTQKLRSDRDFASRFYRLIAIKLSERLRRLSVLMAKRQIKEGEPLRKVLMVFATLNDSDVSWMLANGISEKMPVGTALIEQGKSVPAIYLLLEGMLGVYINTGDNGETREIEVAKRVKGDILGEMSFIDGGMASATVRTIEPSWVLALSQSMLAAKLQEDSGLASRFYLAIVQILSNRCQDLLVRGGLSAIDTRDTNLLSEDIEVEDEIDLDVLEGTAIAATRFDWLIQQLRR